MTMRTLVLAAAALLTSAAAAVSTTAWATPASVNVSIGPELQAKAAKTLGERDVNELAKTLQTSVEKRLAKTGAYDGARIELVLTDATPNRPTFKQLSDKPGLSLQSFGVGGASIQGQAVSQDGKVTPLRYSWMETDIRWEHAATTWSDAENTIARFAHELGRGEAPNGR
jgi:hypothetical protein